MIHYETQEEAATERDIRISCIKKCVSVGERFCPLVNGSCVTNCVCFCMPHVTGREKHWYVYGHYCSNEMFYKEEYNVNCRNQY
jgi:hypothetical protein